MNNRDSEHYNLPKTKLIKEKSVWNEYDQLLQKYKPLDLGKGFANFSPPAYITKALARETMLQDPLSHQYTRSFGHPRLIDALCKLYSPLLERELNPLTEILVTSGAQEAMYDAIIGHVHDGDEVIIMEPFFDSYETIVRRAGGVARFIPLKPTCNSEDTTHSSDWKLDPIELAALFNTKTKMIIVNTPHNPLGKVFNLEELQLIADLCIQWNVLCLSDEVYEWIVFPPFEHIRIATLPGMFERTITMGSAGKTFNVTGWRIGWAYGPANLMVHLQMVHLSCVYMCPTPLQEAIADGFERELTCFGDARSYFVSLALDLKSKRDYLVNTLTSAGLKPVIPDGGVFLMADWTGLEAHIDLSLEKDEFMDFRFTKWMIKNLQLLGLPPTAFYSDEHKKLGESYVRFTFLKKNESLEQANEILSEWKHNDFNVIKSAIE